MKYFLVLGSFLFSGLVSACSPPSEGSSTQTGPTEIINKSSSGVIAYSIDVSAGQITKHNLSSIPRLTFAPSNSELERSVARSISGQLDAFAKLPLDSSPITIATTEQNHEFLASLMDSNTIAGPLAGTLGYGALCIGAGIGGSVATGALVAKLDLQGPNFRDPKAGTRDGILGFTVACILGTAVALISPTP